MTLDRLIPNKIKKLSERFSSGAPLSVKEWALVRVWTAGLSKQWEALQDSHSIASMAQDHNVVLFDNPEIYIYIRLPSVRKQQARVRRNLTQALHKAYAAFTAVASASLPVGCRIEINGTGAECRIIKRG